VPVLALAGDSVSVKRMQNHASYACMDFLRKNGGIFGYSRIYESTTARPVLLGGGYNSGYEQV